MDTCHPPYPPLTCRGDPTGDTGAEMDDPNPPTLEARWTLSSIRSIICPSIICLRAARLPLSSEAWHLSPLQQQQQLQQLLESAVVDTTVRALGLMDACHPPYPPLTCRGDPTGDTGAEMDDPNPPTLEARWTLSSMPSIICPSTMCLPTARLPLCSEPSAAAAAAATSRNRFSVRYISAMSPSSSISCSISSRT